MTEQSLWWGQGCQGTDTAEQSPGCDCPQPLPQEPQAWQGGSVMGEASERAAG